MRPQDIVALVLAVGVILILLMAIVLKLVNPDRPAPTPEEAGFWKDIMLVILGLLGGYVSGQERRARRKKDDDAP